MEGAGLAIGHFSSWRAVFFFDKGYPTIKYFSSVSAISLLKEETILFHLIEKEKKRAGHASFFSECFLSEKKADH